MVIYVSEELECNSVVLDTDYNDAVVVVIKVNNNENMLVGNFYRSPNSCAENDNKLFALINAICESKQLIIIFSTTVRTSVKISY